MLTNKLNLPQPIVDALTTEYQYTESRYSVTSLLKGSTQTILERRHQSEIVEDVSDKIWALFGSAVHKILEEAQESESQLKENKIVIKFGEYELSGIFDLFDDATHTITDYKTASCWKVIMKDFEDYRTQIKIYAYMMREIGFKVTQGEVVYLLKDHTKSKAKFDATYPQSPVYKDTFEITDKDMDDVYQLLCEKFSAIKLAEATKDEDLPECSKKDRWYRGEKFAIMKGTNKKAVKLFENEDGAKQYLEAANDTNLWIEHREGIDGRCDEYCSVCKWCPYYKRKHEHDQG